MKGPSENTFEVTEAVEEVYDAQTQVYGILIEVGDHSELR